ncbi:MAG: hypothetical protein ABR924_18585 [Terracidiphilus sp.]|jgi:hypothetical protein
MSRFSIFEHIDLAIISDESSTVKASKSPSAWPSEASAIRVDKSFYNIYGTCLRKAFYRMIGWPKKEETSAEGPWKWVIGRAVENKVTDLCVLAQAGDNNESLYVANGVKHYIRDLYLSIEMDIIVRDPATNRGWILECKSYDGYFAEKQIETEMKPKEENLIQLCIYLWAARTGKGLKEIIHKSLDDRAKLDALGKPHRNRAEANLDILDKMDDGPLGAKLIYISRGTCNRTEFDVEIMQDHDGFHYPMVNGMPYRIFTVESIYDRFVTLQSYWFRARQQAYEILSDQGVLAPPTLNLLMTRGDVPEDMTVYRDLTKQEWTTEKAYLEQLEETVRTLHDEYFPPPEYEYSYSADRIKRMGAAKLIGKTKLKEWNDGKINRLGDWQCSYCPFAATGCVARQRPDLAYQLYDISNLPDNVEVQIGA